MLFSVLNYFLFETNLLKPSKHFKLFKLSNSSNTEQYHCHLSIVSRGLPGAFLGVSWGLGGVHLSEPPGNSQLRLINSSLYIGRVYHGFRWNEIINTSFLMIFCHETN